MKHIQLLRLHIVFLVIKGDLYTHRSLRFDLPVGLLRFLILCFALLEQALFDLFRFLVVAVLREVLFTLFISCKVGILSIFFVPFTLRKDRDVKESGLISGDRFVALQSHRRFCSEQAVLILLAARFQFPYT